MPTIKKINVGGVYYDLSGGLSEEVKAASLQIADNVAYKNTNGQQYYDDLYGAFYPPASLVSITAEYTQSGTVYNTDTIDSLKTDLVVTANFDDGSSQIVTSGYALSGELVPGTSTITVSYGGKTTTFDVAVTEFVPEYPKTIVPSTSDGCGFGTLNLGGAYPYQPNTNKNRLHLQGADALGYPVEMGKTYTISVNTDLSDTIQAAINSINQTGKTTIENKGTGAASMRADTGWQTLPYVYTPPKVNGQDTALIWIILRKSTDAVFSALTDITSVVITES